MQVQEQPTVEFLQSVISALQKQREVANDNVAHLAAQLAIVTNKLNEAEERLKNLTTPHSVGN